MDSVLLVILIGSAAFFAGFLNAIAGGGTFLTLPALIFAGVPPVAANATSTLAVLPGYLGAALGFRSELAQLPRRETVTLTVVSLAGGLVGAGLLLVTSNQTFELLLPWLLLFATVAFSSGDRIQSWLQSRGLNGRDHLAPVVFGVSVYGGYFNGGLGIVLMACLTVAGIQGMNLINGLKNYISLVLCLISALTFSVAGIVSWRYALLMMGLATLGGYTGALVSKQVPKQILRISVIVIGLGMSVLFFFKSLPGEIS
jgi:uncharacterized membrane protein YfcA